MVVATLSSRHQLDSVLMFDRAWLKWNQAGRPVERGGGSLKGGNIISLFNYLAGKHTPLLCFQFILNSFRFYFRIIRAKIYTYKK